MNFSLSLFIIIISIAAATSGSIFSNSDPAQYFVPSAVASSGDDCLETDWDFNTEAGTCRGGGGGGGGGRDVGGCPDGEIYIQGQGCTFETVVTACPPGQISQGGQCVKENPFGDPECTQGLDCPGDFRGPERTETSPEGEECVPEYNCEGDPAGPSAEDPQYPMAECDPEIQSCLGEVTLESIETFCAREPTPDMQNKCELECSAATVIAAGGCAALGYVPAVGPWLAGGCGAGVGIKSTLCSSECDDPYATVGPDGECK